MNRDGSQEIRNLQVTPASAATFFRNIVDRARERGRCGQLASIGERQLA